MMFRLFFVIGGLFKILTALEIGSNQDIKMTMRFEHHQKSACHASQSKRNESSKGYDQCYDQVIKIYENYPEITRNESTGVLGQFKIYTGVLENATKGNSTILPTSSSSILKVLDKLYVLDDSSESIIKNFRRILKPMLSGHKKIVKTLSPYLGELTESFNEAISAYGEAYTKVIEQFNNRGIERRCRRCAQIDFEEIVKRTHHLINITAAIAKSALNDCACRTNDETFEAILVLLMIVVHPVTSTQGINLSMATMMVLESDDISTFLHPCTKLWHPFIVSIADFITPTTNELSRSPKLLLKKFVDQTNYLNDRSDGLYKCFDIEFNEKQIIIVKQ